MTSLCVEGWRGINHSFSIVNQWQLLELVDKDIKISHLDKPFFKSSWNVKQNSCGIEQKLINKINSIPKAQTGGKFDVLYRIYYPFNLAEGKADKVFVFGAPSLGNCKGMTEGATIKEASKRDSLIIITPSQWSKMGFINSGFPEEMIKVINHGVNSSCFYPIDLDKRKILREGMGIKEDDFILLNVGALTSNKGVNYLIRAYCELKNSYPNLKLIIKDSSDLYNINLKDIINKFNIKSSNIFTNNNLSDIISISQNLNISQLNSLYNISDAYISPYLAEGFNLPPLEAAACGKPILVTAGGATDEYFSKEIGLQISSKKNVDSNGRTYLLPSYESLVIGIKKLIESKDSFDYKLCSDYVVKNFSWLKAVNSLVDQF